MRTRKGFTMIELMLAVGFLSALVITIAVLINMVTGIYQKGLSLRAVNAVGKQIVDELTRTVGGSPIPDRNINPQDTNGNNMIDLTDLGLALQQYFYSKTTGLSGGEVQTGGVFCTGMSSYIWNTQPSYAAWREDSSTNVYRIRNTATNETNVYKLARIPDPTRQVCQDALPSDVNPGGEHTFNSISEPVEMISSDESDLILYDFTVFNATQNALTGQVFYSATFILATMRGGVNILDSGNFCSEDGGFLGGTFGLRTDFNYCAVNKFNFAMRATGFTEGEDQYGEQGLE